MPRKIAIDDDMPRRRRGAKAAAMEAEAERGLVMRILLHSPKDMVAGALAFAAVSAIIANALFLQAGRHPSPMFGTVTTMPAAVAGAQPVAASAPGGSRGTRCRSRAVGAKGHRAEERRRQKRRAQERSQERSADQSGQGDGGAAGRASAVHRSRGRRRRSRSARNETIANQTPASRRVAAVQRTLTEYGYGQLKPTGTVGSDTQAAIQKFERERKIPVTGQMSDRLVRELTAMIGRPID